MNATYEFDKGVEIPTAVIRQGVNVDMLKAMEVGDSKWWAEKDAKKAQRFYRVAKKLGIPIMIRKVGKTDARGPGVRLWRLDPADKQARDNDAIARREAEALAAATKAPADKQIAPKAAKKAAAKPAKKPAAKPAKKAAAKSPKITDSGLEPARPKNAPKASKKSAAQPAA